MSQPMTRREWVRCPYCGSKATGNARIGPDGRVVTEGEQVLLGGNDTYLAMCHACWRKRIRAEAASKKDK